MGKRVKNILPYAAILAGLIALWQIVYLLHIFPETAFSSVPQIAGALVDGFASGELGAAVLSSLSFILRGLLIGAGMALVLSALAITFSPFHKVYSLLISLFDPLPGIALLPLAILWFGTGDITIIFLIIHGVLWPLSRSIMDSFATVPALYVETGRNYGLRGLRLVGAVYLPASLPGLLSGIKTGWARAWRALISAEMVFGVSGSMGGGLGWYIFVNRYKMETASMFASLVVIIAIGLIVEYGLFGEIERNTVKKWGLTR